ncbi:hypothetical protein CLOM_g17382 [Closterium sp. NIES-68]|nr:hypothetical protein CLOM_g17382 [Closterium sp. NIES-68]GJP66642.1 hypothetical protein CLOP_g23555 [Closterium sp. NIES-67]
MLANSHAMGQPSVPSPNWISMAETEGSPSLTASIDAYVLRPLQRASSAIGSGDLWQRAADMDEAVAQSHTGSTATTNESAATGKKWSVMGSTARKVQRMLFADKSASVADRKTKRLLPSLLSSSRRQERGHEMTLRGVAGGSCRVESESADDGGEDGGFGLERRSVSFPHFADGEIIDRVASAEERGVSEPGVADPEGRSEGDLLSPRSTAVAAGADGPRPLNADSASRPELNSPHWRIASPVAVLPRPVRPQTAPSGSDSSLHVDAPDSDSSRRKAAPVAPAVPQELSAASGAEVQPRLADERSPVAASEPSCAALTLSEPLPPIDASLMPPLPSPAAPRPPSSGGNRSGRLRAERGMRGGERGGEGLRVDVASRRQRSRHSGELAWAEALGGQVLERSKTAERDASSRGRVARGSPRVGGHHHLWASWDCDAGTGMGRGGPDSLQDGVESLDEASWGAVSVRERPTSSGGRVPSTAVSPRVVRFNFKQHIQQVALATARDELAQ